jgi:hypothetical protein
VVRAQIRSGIGLATLLTLVACQGGGVVDESTPSPCLSSLEYSRNPGVLVVEADTYGGLTPPPTGRHVAEVSIYGDGFVVLASDEQSSVGTDRVVRTGHISEEELAELLSFIADTGFFELDDQYMPSAALPDMPWRHVIVNLLGCSKTVAIYPHDFADAPTAFSEVYSELTGVEPSDATVFTPSSGVLTATDLGPIDGLPGGQQSQVAPWDSPLVGIELADAREGVHLAGDQYGVVEEFLLRYPPGQLFGSQQGQAYQVLLEADLPWEDASP